MDNIMKDSKPHTLESVLIPEKYPKTFGQAIATVAPLVLEDDTSGLKDKGKLLGHCDELLVESYIKAYFPMLEIIWRKDLKSWMDKNPLFTPLKNDTRVTFDKNGAGFDVVIANMQNQKYALSQLKLRLNKKQLHFENTRRMSEKNEGHQSNKGHVAYGITEADIVIVMTPTEKDLPGNLNNYPISNLIFMSFFMKDLEDKSTPGYCVTRIGKETTKNFGYSIEYTLSKHLELE